MQRSNKSRLHIWMAAIAAMISLLACEPVIAIGWREILFIFILIAIVFGPPVYRLLRKLEDFHRREKTDRD